MSMDRTQAGKLAALLRKTFLPRQRWQVRVACSFDHSTVYFSRGVWTLRPSLCTDISQTRWIAEAKGFTGSGSTPAEAMKQVRIAARAMSRHYQQLYRSLADE